jgi:hypothetical protein
MTIEKRQLRQTMTIHLATLQRPRSLKHALQNDPGRCCVTIQRVEVIVDLLKKLRLT